MNEPHTQPLHTGGDPRALADDGVLREELSKLTHPAHPDVDWKKVAQARALLPGNTKVSTQAKSWSHQLNANTISHRNLNGWHVTPARNCNN